MGAYILHVPKKQSNKGTTENSYVAQYRAIQQE